MNLAVRARRTGGGREWLHVVDAETGEPLPGQIRCDVETSFGF
jgi:hypothetical protein